MPSYEPDKPDTIFQTQGHSQKEHKREVYLSYLKHCLQIGTLSLAIEKARGALSTLPTIPEKEEKALPSAGRQRSHILGNLLFGLVLGFLGWRNIWLYLSFSPRQGKEWGFLSYGLIFGGLCLLFAIHFLRHGIMNLLLQIHKGELEEESPSSDTPEAVGDTTPCTISTPAQVQKALTGLQEELLSWQESFQKRGILSKKEEELIPAAYLYDQLRLEHYTTLYGEEGALASLDRFQKSEGYEGQLENIFQEMEKYRQEQPTLCECLEEAAKLSASLESDFSKALKSSTPFSPDSLPSYRDIREKIKVLQSEA